MIAVVEDFQSRQIARLREESKRLKTQLEASGEPVRLTPNELRQLAQKAKGMSRDDVANLSILHPDDLQQLFELLDSAEDR
jgi:hypothetical protein